ncbi:MAG: hypothetical protein ABI624_09850 [Casimicrobiaceae bacterium]
MNTLQTTMRGWLIWLVPLAVLVLLILWQTDWGHAFLREPPSEAGIVARPLTVALLPEYQPAAAPDTARDVVDRSLFNPTRRPAPAAIAEAAKPRLQRGQFALSGTLMVDGKATAFLRETSGGKSRRVGQGETVNGMVVSEIKPDRIRLTLGDESEELTLKLAVGPRTTVQPVVAAPAGAPVTATAARMPPGAAPAVVRDVADVLAERRRAAREAEAAAAGRPPGSPIPGAAGAPATAVSGNIPPPPVGVLSTDPQWQSVYQRYQQPRR